MANYVELSDSRKEFLNDIKGVLDKSSELIAFIKVYGSMYDKYYMSFIVNINNLSERYMHSLNSDVIDSLYNAYCSFKEASDSEKEIFEKLRIELYKIPTFSIIEVPERGFKKRVFIKEREV